MQLGRTESTTTTAGTLETEMARDIAQAIAALGLVRARWTEAGLALERAAAVERAAREAYEEARAQLGALVRRGARLGAQEPL